MRKIGIIILTLSILTLGCQQTHNQEKISEVDTVSSERKKTLDNENSTDESKELDQFEITFEHEDKGQKSKQKLGVTWLTKDSIEFRLITEDQLCDTDYFGNAKNKYADMDPESDEGETGESYLSSEYVNEEPTYSLKIRISLDKDRARIIYGDKSNEETDCMPTSNLVLVKKNAR